MKKLLALALVLAFTVSAHATIFGPLFSGSSQVTPPTGTAPVVTSLACTIALPIANGTNVNLVGGGTCAYTATCASAACAGINAITGWAITTQSTANSYSITNAGILQGGSAAGSVTTGSYTVTVTATNSTGTSPGVVQSITTFQPPVVASLACSIKSPITNNTNVTLQAGGNCQYTATCGGGACSGGNAISGWSVVADTCTSCYQVTSSGVLQGSTNAATVTNQTDTVTVVATNAGGNSPGVGQTVTAVTVPAITNQNFNVMFPVANPLTIGTMAATPTPTSWAITAVSAGGTGATTSDFAISSGGVLTSTSSAPTDITSPGTVIISLTATNATGTSPTGTATLTIGATCPQGTALADGCTGAQLHGTIVQANLADPQKVSVLYISAGSGYTNGTYTWTSSGGGCSPNATGTITVSGGALGRTNYTVSNEGAGCTSRPTIALPGGIGAGTGGSIVPVVYQITPHNASGTAAGANWNVAGVDYPVGYDTTLTLKDPTAGGLPSGATFSGHTVTLGGSGGTLNGYDFSLHSTHLAVSASGWTITNNKWVCNIGTETELDFIHVGSGTINATIKYNSFNGSSSHSGGCISGGQNSAIGSSQTGGTATIQYNYCTNEDSKCLNFQGNGNVVVDEQYNFWTQFGECQCGSHGEAEYAFVGAGMSGPTAIFTWTQTFNVMWLPPWTSPENNTSAQSIQADGTIINNADVENNYILSQSNGLYTGSGNQCNGGSGGPTANNTCVGSAPIFVGRNALSGSDWGAYTGTSVMLNNVLDYSGGFFPYNAQHGAGTGGAAGFGAIADINAGTGHGCNTTTCN